MERRPAPEKPDLAEKGSPKDGQPQSMDRRLFMQLLVFGGALDMAPLGQALDGATKAHGFNAVLYADVNDPRGAAVLTMHESPGFFVDVVRSLVTRPPFDRLVLKPEYTMLGRTYSLGYEPDLEETLFGRPTRTAMNPEWPWAVWYPLRRSGRFMQLPAEEQKNILMEHGRIGMSFGSHDLGHDIRLACHGLDKQDNDFVIGLTGKDLFPLSALVQAMRKTQQTSLYLERLGPFFVGKAVWRGSGTKG